MAESKIKESTFIEIANDKTDTTVRQALQSIGEYFRERFGRLVWANSARTRLAAASEQVTIITDGRHPEEEIHWMKKTCCDLATVIAVRIRTTRVPVKRGHPSEDHIADEPDSSFDVIIENDGTLEDLKIRAKGLAFAIKTEFVRD